MKLSDLFALHEDMKELESIMRQRKAANQPASVMEAKYHKARITFESACETYERHLREGMNK